MTSRTCGTRAHDNLRIIPPDAPPLTVEIVDSPPPRAPALEAAIDRRWAQITGANPRAFDGPVLAFADHDPAHNTITAYRERYRRLAAQPEVDTGVVQLGVTGLCADDAGKTHALIARRTAATRAYAGLWECAPSGGLDPPDGTRIDTAELFEAFGKECGEELDLPSAPASVRAAAVLRDPVASSVEIVIEARFDGTPGELTPRAIGSGSHAHGWEYDAARWLPIEAIPGLVRKEAGTLTPPTVALLSGLYGSP